MKTLSIIPLFKGKRLSLQKRTIMNFPSTHQDYKMEFVVFALESAAKKAQIPTEELYKRMEKQGLIEKFLFECYDTLHTQGRDYIADVTLEALHNWEEAAQEKEEKL